jgi:hypothetical protein
VRAVPTYGRHIHDLESRANRTLDEYA